MNIFRSKRQKIDDLKSIYQSRAEESRSAGSEAIPSRSALDLVQDDINSWSRIFSWASVIGPICCAFLYLLFPIDFSAFVCWHLLIDGISTLALIAVLFFLSNRLYILQSVAREIEISKSNQRQEIDGLKRRNEALGRNQSFYISAMQMLGKSMRDGIIDIESLARVVIASICYNISSVTNGDDLTINLYELRHGRIRMIISATRYQYCDRDSKDAPFLYGLQDGMDIRDESIQEYYCIQCIRGKIKAKGGKFLIPDWKSLVQKFKWDGWDPGEKEEILRNNDRDKCVELGFKYNQYFAFKIRREDGTEIYFELIANRETQIASEKELFHVTHSLMETYSPLVNLLWDISDASGERS